MRAAVAFVLLFVTSTLAYSVLVPSNVTGWTSQGSQNLTWNRVNTDPSFFAVFLTNQQIGGFQDQQLAVESNINAVGIASILLSPNGTSSFPIGSNFRLNIVQDSNSRDSILAQSLPFDITDGSSGTTGTTPTATSPSTSQTSGTITDSSSSATSADINPTSSSGAASSYPVQTGLLALFSLLGFAFA